jgi:hypothetical protein
MQPVYHAYTSGVVMTAWNSSHPIDGMVGGVEGTFFQFQFCVKEILIKFVSGRSARRLAPNALENDNAGFLDSTKESVKKEPLV